MYTSASWLERATLFSGVPFLIGSIHTLIAVFPALWLGIQAQRLHVRSLATGRAHYFCASYLLCITSVSDSPNLNLPYWHQAIFPQLEAIRIWVDCLGGICRCPGPVAQRPVECPAANKVIHGKGHVPAGSSNLGGLTQ